MLLKLVKPELKDYGGKKAMMHPYGTLLSDVWTDLHRIRHPKRRDQHPCQLPEPLLERLVLKFCKVCRTQGKAVTTVEHKNIQGIDFTRLMK
jgi:hypothetical protein